MNLKKLLFALSVIAFAPVHGQLLTFHLCTGSTPVMDGSIGPGEWDDANRTTILLSNDSIVIKLKHNGDSLFFLFDGPLESSNVLFPEVLIDEGYTNTGIWDSTNWWFHVSATDCYYNGQYGNYSGTCQPDHPTWSGLPNITPGFPYTDIVEMAIPFSTIGINTGDTIRLALVVTNTASAWKYWPYSASRNNPNTWMPTVISTCLSSIPEVNAEPEWNIFPNPATSDFTIQLRAAEPATLRLYTISGQQCLQQELPAGDAATAVSVAALAPGIYFAELCQGGSCSRKKIVLY